MAALLLYFADEQAPALRLAEALGLPAAAIERHRFPDDELRLRLPFGAGQAIPRQVLLYRSLDRPNDKLVELLLVAGEARALGVQRLLLVAPVTVAAASLPGRQAALMGLLVLAATVSLFFVSLPLPWQAGTELNLPPLAVEDARKGHQRPKVEEYGDMLFAAMHLLEMTPEGLQVGEVHVFVGERFVVSVRHRSAQGFLYLPQTAVGDGPLVADLRLCCRRQLGNRRLLLVHDALQATDPLHHIDDLIQGLVHRSRLISEEFVS